MKCVKKNKIKKHGYLKCLKTCMKIWANDIDRELLNNYRKMHGLPMRRKGGAY